MEKLNIFKDNLRLMQMLEKEQFDVKSQIEYYQDEIEVFTLNTKPLTITFKETKKGVTSLSIFDNEYATKFRALTFKMYTEKINSLELRLIDIENQMKNFNYMQGGE